MRVGGRIAFGIDGAPLGVSNDIRTGAVSDFLERPCGLYRIGRESRATEPSAHLTGVSVFWGQRKLPNKTAAQVNPLCF